MPIEVEGPDGAVIEFPDGTPAEEMKAAMRRYYAGWQAQGTPSTAQPAAAPARPVSILDSLTPPGVDKRPGDFIGYPEQPALGDFLRPVFGGHNPLAEIYGKFIDPFVPSEPETEEEKARADWLANRGYGERALDSLAAVGNLPVAVVTGGRASVPDILNYFGLTGAAQSYGRSLEDFSAANAPQLEALGAVGEVALGVPALSSLGRMPRSHVPRRAPGPAQIEPPPNPQLPAPAPAAAEAGADANALARAPGRLQPSYPAPRSAGPAPQPNQVPRPTEGPQGAAAPASRVEYVPPANAAPDEPIVEFTTAKGSTYVGNARGSTTRNKAPRSDPGHEGDYGLKPPSDRTYFVAPEHQQRLALPMSPAGQPRAYIVDTGQDRLFVATWNQAEGKYGIASDQRMPDGSLGVPVSRHPVMGWHPVELWNTQGSGSEAAAAARDQLSQRLGGSWYETVHHGNVVTDIRPIKGELRGSPSGAPSAGAQTAAAEAQAAAPEARPPPNMQEVASGGADNSGVRPVQPGQGQVPPQVPPGGGGQVPPGGGGQVPPGGGQVPPGGGQVPPGGGQVPPGYNLPPASAARVSNADRSRRIIADYEAAQRLGIRIPGAAFSNYTQGLYKQLSDLPVVGGPAKTSMETALAQSGSALENIAGRLGSTGPGRAEMGRLVEGALDRFTKRRVSVPGGRNGILSAPPSESSFKSYSSALYERAWDNIEEAMRRGRSRLGEARLMGGFQRTREVLEGIRSQNLQMLNQGLIERGAISERLANPLQASGLLGATLESILSPQWRANYQTIRNIRSTLRRKQSGIPENQRHALTNAQIDAIESALTEDMVSQLARNADAAEALALDIEQRIAASGRSRVPAEAISGAATRQRYFSLADAREMRQAAQGFRQSIDDFREADAFKRTWSERIEGVKRLLNATTVEQIADRIFAASLERSSGSIRMLQHLSVMLRASEMREVAASILRRMGTPLPSARGVGEEIGFSVSTFVSNWRRMTPEARELLFGRGEYAQAIDDLAAVSDRLAQIEAMTNTSRSATNALTVGGILATGGAMATGFDGLTALLGQVGLGYGASLLLSSPVYTRWLVGYARLRLAAAQGRANAGSLLARHVRRLAGLARNNRNLIPVVAAAAAGAGLSYGNREGAREQPAQNMQYAY